MKRRLFTFASALSLLVCLATLIVWSSSFFAFAPFGQYWTTSWDGNSGGYVGHGWIALKGSIHLLRNDCIVQPAPTSNGVNYHHSGIDPVPEFQPDRTKLGFAYVSRVSGWRERGTNRRVTRTTQQLSFPAWLPAFLTAILPIRWLATPIRQRRLRKRGFCPSCGYDLRASTDRCPECGIAPSKLGRGG